MNEKISLKEVNANWETCIKGSLDKLIKTDYSGNEQFWTGFFELEDPTSYFINQHYWDKILHIEIIDEIEDYSYELACGYVYEAWEDYIINSSIEYKEFISALPRDRNEWTDEIHEEHDEFLAPDQWTISWVLIDNIIKEYLGEPEWNRLTQIVDLKKKAEGEISLVYSYWDKQFDIHTIELLEYSRQLITKLEFLKMMQAASEIIEKEERNEVLAKMSFEEFFNYTLERFE